MGERSWQAHQQSTIPPDADAQHCIKMMMALAAGLDEHLPGSIGAIGVSFGGPVDHQQGVVRLSHHIPGWEGFPLRDRLVQRFGAPAVIANDANAAAFGEFHSGAGLGCESMLYITISTGVGGGLIFNGKLWEGRDGMAGEIGHMSIDPNGPVCTCGKKGCVESIASGSAIACRAQKKLLDPIHRGHS